MRVLSGAPSTGLSLRSRFGTFRLSHVRTSRWKASSSGEYVRSIASMGSTTRAALATRAPSGTH